MAGYIPHTQDDVKKMMGVIGIKDIDELFAVLPEGVRLNRKLNLEEGLSEIEVLDRIDEMARKNKVYLRSYL